MCPGPGASIQHISGAILAERGWTLTELEEQSRWLGWPCEDVWFHKKSLHIHTHTENIKCFQVCVYTWLLWRKKKGSPWFLMCIYLTICSDTPERNKFVYCIPVLLSASTWEMHKILPSWWAQLERAARNMVCTLVRYLRASWTARTKGKSDALGWLWHCLMLMKTLNYQSQETALQTPGGISSLFQQWKGGGSMCKWNHKSPLLETQLWNWQPCEIHVLLFTEISLCDTGCNRNHTSSFCLLRTSSKPLQAMAWQVLSFFKAAFWHWVNCHSV